MQIGTLVDKVMDLWTKQLLQINTLGTVYLFSYAGCIDELQILIYLQEEYVSPQALHY